MTGGGWDGEKFFSGEGPFEPSTSEITKFDSVK